MKTYVNNASDIIPHLITYSQDEEPTLSQDGDLAIWIDTDDSDTVYLVYRRGSGDQVKQAFS